MRNTLLAGGMAVVLAFLVGCNEHDQGVREGREAARKLRGDSGEVGVRATKVGVDLYPGKINDKKSSEWNSGFREGFKKEVEGK